MLTTSIGIFIAIFAIIKLALFFIAGSMQLILSLVVSFLSNIKRLSGHDIDGDMQIEYNTPKKLDLFRFTH